MRITWLSTNTNMRWPWSLAQQGMTVSSLLVGALEAEIFWCKLILYITVFTLKGFPSPQIKPLHLPAFWRTARRLDSSMNLQVRSTMTLKKQLKMTLKRLLSNSLSAFRLTSVCPIVSISVSDPFCSLQLFSFICSYHWICHLLQRPSYATKLRNPQLWRHIEIALCLTLNLLRMTTR